jgi:Mg-chelatase subunit ChlD
MDEPQEISIKRPKNVKQTKTFEQLGILVLDGSGSMEEQTAQHISKADAVTSAVNDLFSRFKASGIRNNFSFAIINYDKRSIVKMPPTPVKDVDDHGDYNPMEGLGGATYISEGLKDAKKIAEDFLNQSQEGGVAKSVVVLIMTDGVDMTQPETISMANTLKQMDHVKVAGCFFETLGADIDAMNECADYVRGLCSTPMDFSSVSSADMLRTFFIASMSNMAGGL